MNMFRKKCSSLLEYPTSCKTGMWEVLQVQPTSPQLYYTEKCVRIQVVWERNHSYTKRREAGNDGEN